MPLPEVGWGGRDTSGLSHEQIHRWVWGADPAALAAARDEHAARGAELRAAAERLDRSHAGAAEQWQGRDADAAATRVRTVRAQLTRLSDAVGAQARSLDGVRAAVERVQAAVGPPRPPALGPLAGPPATTGLPAAVGGADTDGFAAFRSAQADEAAARVAYRAYLDDTATVARTAPGGRAAAVGGGEAGGGGVGGGDEIGPRGTGAGAGHGEAGPGSGAPGGRGASGTPDAVGRGAAPTRSGTSAGVLARAAAGGGRGGAPDALDPGRPGGGRSGLLGTGPAGTGSPAGAVVPARAADGPPASPARPGGPAASEGAPREAAPREGAPREGVPREGAPPPGLPSAAPGGPTAGGRGPTAGGRGPTAGGRVAAAPGDGPGTARTGARPDHLVPIDPHGGLDEDEPRFVAPPVLGAPPTPSASSRPGPEETP